MCTHDTANRRCDPLPARPSHPRGRPARRLVAAGSLAAGLALLAPTQMTQAGTRCGPEVKQALAQELAVSASLPDMARLQFETDLHANYADCAMDREGLTKELVIAASQCNAEIGYAGNLTYGDLSCCGYDPAHRTFSCPVRIKQRFNLNPSPAPVRVHVLNCVADNDGVMHSVGHSTVHLTDSHGASTWTLVVAQASQNLNLIQAAPGTSRRARSILSLGLTPTDCEFRPIWGNWLDYPIHLYR